MWLLTAVGPVHGQLSFTFVLARSKSYTVGRDKQTDIRFDSKHVRPTEGTLHVGGWDPSQGRKAPELVWRPEKRKNGAAIRSKVVTLEKGNDYQAIDKNNYSVQESEAGEVQLQPTGSSGIELSEDVWFVATWQDLAVQYGRMKDEPDETRDVLIRHCIPWTESFEVAQAPTLVLSSTLKSIQECNYAVCYGIRILLPSYLHDLLVRIAACWKQLADHEDSFRLPDETSPEYQPPIDPAVPNTRKAIEAWLPDPTRQTLWTGWKVMGLKATRAAPAEKRFLEAMGCDYVDIDVAAKPITSGEDFANRLAHWLEEVDTSPGGRSKAVVVHFVNVKATVEKRGVSWDGVIAATCHRLGVALSSGTILWGSVQRGGVEAFLRATAANVLNPPVAQVAEADASDAAQDKAGAHKGKDVAAQEDIEMSAAPPAIPSTFPDDSDPQAKPSRVSPANAGTEKQAPPIGDAEDSKAAEPVAAPPTTRKPLKRRAQKQETSMQPSYADYEYPPPPQDDPPQTQTQALVQETDVPMPPAAQQFTQRLSSQTASQSVKPGVPSRLKRRAGGAMTQQPSLFSFGVESSLHPIKDEETPAEIRELYEQTKREAQAQSSLSANRNGTVRTTRGAPVASGETSGGRAIRSASVESVRELPSSTTDHRRPEGMDVDIPEEVEEVEEDFVQRTLKNAARARREGRTQATQSAGVTASGRVPTSRARSPSEVPEELVDYPVKRPRRDSPIKSVNGNKTAATQGPTKDEAFLEAISQSVKAKKALDELDQEFNQLRIPKRTAPGKPDGSTVTRANEWEHPDYYRILQDFDGDDMRGNFIQIVKKDMFRKDGGSRVGDRAAPVAEDGRPNFKKFKKKEIIRREPLSLVLVDKENERAAMGQPYWGSQQKLRSTQASQALNGGDEESLPLLPRTQRRLLNQREPSEDAEMRPPTATKRRGGVRNASDTQASGSGSQTTAPAASTRRGQSRASSVASDVSFGEAADASDEPRMSTRTRRSATSVSTRPRKNAIIIEESEEEEGVDFTPSGAGESTREDFAASHQPTSTAGAPASTSRRTATTTSKRSTQAQEASSGSSESRRMASRQLGGMTPSLPSGTLRGRKALVIDDDEDEDEGTPGTATASKVMQKRRRLA